MCKRHRGVARTTLWSLYSRMSCTREKAQYTFDSLSTLSYVADICAISRLMRMTVAKKA